MADREHPHSENDAAGKSAEPELRQVVTPPIDIYQDAEGLVLVADLPGVTGETSDVQVQDNKLMLVGRVGEVVPADARVIHQEFPLGDFLRSFILSDDVNHDRIDAGLTSGVLTVRLPRASRGEPRKITVRTE